MLYRALPSRHELKSDTLLKRGNKGDLGALSCAMRFQLKIKQDLSFHCARIPYIGMHFKKPLQKVGIHEDHSQHVTSKPLTKGVTLLGRKTCSRKNYNNASKLKWEREMAQKRSGRGPN